MKNETEFKRNCPECGKTLYYNRKQSLNACIKYNTKCFDCANKTRRDQSYNYDDHYDQDRGEYFLFCTQCNNKIWTDNKRYVRKLLKCGTKCKNCSASSPETVAKVSKASKLAHKNPASKFNTEEYKEKCRNNLQNSVINNGGRAGKQETELFELVKHFGFIHNKWTIRIDRYFPDIIHTDAKIIIEFNGDKYHANPVIFKDDKAIIKFRDGRQKIAKEIRDYDQERYRVLENLGYTIFIVWEHDFRSIGRRKKIMNELFQFIQNQLALPQQRHPVVVSE